MGENILYVPWVLKNTFPDSVGIYMVGTLPNPRSSIQLISWGRLMQTPACTFHYFQISSEQFLQARDPVQS